jgi:uncharacterized protein (DUF2267 family)
MDYEAFVTTVARMAGIDRASAERAGYATLQTVAERVTREEMRQVAALPPMGSVTTPLPVTDPIGNRTDHGNRLTREVTAVTVAGKGLACRRSGAAVSK